MKKQFMVLVEDAKVTKEILAKKANFTDIIMNIDKKVDKQEIKTLELMIQDASQRISTLHYHESTSNVKTQSPEQHKSTKTSHKLNGTLFSHSLGRRSGRVEVVDNATSLFMCGVENNFGGDTRNFTDNRIIYSHHGKRKSMRSTGAINNDITL